MKKIVSYFLQGLLYLVPISVTIYVLVVGITFTDGLINDLEVMRDYRIPGLGLVVIVVLVTLVGYIGPKLITTPLARLMHRAIRSAPLVRVIYTSVRDLMSAFVGKKRKFGKPALVSLDDSGVMYRLGFVTTEDMTDLQIKDKVAVFLPNSYGLLGDLVIVPADRITLIDAHPADVMKFVVSGGVTKIGEKDLDDDYE